MGIFSFIAGTLFAGVSSVVRMEKEQGEGAYVRELIKLQNKYYSTYKKEDKRDVRIIEQNHSYRTFLDRLYSNQYEDNPVKTWLAKDHGRLVNEDKVFACTNAEQIAYEWQLSRKEGLPGIRRLRKQLKEAEKEFEKECREKNIPLLNLSTKYYWR